MTLHVYNSLSRKKEAFVPLEEGKVGIYVCGPTVYGHSHVGHAKSYVAFDVIVKWLRHLDYSVRYVQNITDVGHLTDNDDDGEDKILRQAQIDKVHPLEVVDEYMRSYFEDMEALGVAHPNMYVRATQHIGEQIQQIEQIIAAGHAYEIGGNVYFDVASFPEYGILSGRTAEDQREGSRVNVRSDKRDPRDFALWKSAEGTGHILRWKSPWSEGFPGWHVECSAMAMKYLGGSFDIHGGGNENKFPHHECEIAQARASGQGNFARYWLHNNMINVDDQKMGKSLGNAIMLKDVLKESRPEAMRLFLLSTHYSRPSNYTQKGIQSAEAGVDRLTTARAALLEVIQTKATEGTEDATYLGQVESSVQAMTDAMNDDFNSPVAISALFDLVTQTNRAVTESLSAAAAQKGLEAMTTFAVSIFGIMPQGESASSGGELESPLMDLILDLRQLAREEKNWGAADLIRDRLGALGVTVNDKKDGATWQR